MRWVRLVMVTPPTSGLVPAVVIFGYFYRLCYKVASTSYLLAAQPAKTCIQYPCIYSYTLFFRFDTSRSCQPPTYGGTRDPKALAGPMGPRMLLGPVGPPSPGHGSHRLKENPFCHSETVWFAGLLSGADPDVLLQTVARQTLKRLLLESVARSISITLRNHVNYVTGKSQLLDLSRYLF